MTRLDEFLEPLHHGVWEVVVPKESVTEPLDSGWERSQINIPSPGTIDSYRKGQYHVHETATEWRVHLDRYDPKIHPILHLIDDAPLVMMISGTFTALLMGGRTSRDTDEESVLEDQRTAWQVLVLIGFALALVGFLIISDPLTTYRGILTILIPFTIVCVGIIMIANALRGKVRKRSTKGSIFLGICIIVIGVISFELPLEVWSVILLAILGLWAFSSAIVSVRDLISGRPGVPGGFYQRLILGILSLLLAVLILVEPVAVVAILVEILGLIALLGGILLIVDGVKLRKRMHVEDKRSPEGT
jgi:uncharacterized membrane protein HdeD (DUF308 family)